MNNNDILLNAYTKICSLYKENKEISALIEENNGHFFIYYNPFSCPCNGGKFETLEEARATVKKNRPTAYIMDYSQDIMHSPDVFERVAIYRMACTNLLQVTDESSANWDIFVNTRTGVFYSIARPNSGASNSFFGRVDHVRKLYNQGYMKDEDFTNAGRAYVFGQEANR